MTHDLLPQFHTEVTKTREQERVTQFLNNIKMTSTQHA